MNLRAMLGQPASFHPVLCMLLSARIQVKCGGLGSLLVKFQPVKRKAATLLICAATADARGPSALARDKIQKSACAGNNSPQIAPPTGAPAITVPMGYVRDVTQSALPAGLQFLARPWDEGRLLGIAYAFEQATQYRMCDPVASISVTLHIFCTAQVVRQSTVGKHQRSVPVSVLPSCREGGLTCDIATYLSPGRFEKCLSHKGLPCNVGDPALPRARMVPVAELLIWTETLHTSHSYAHHSKTPVLPAVSHGGFGWGVCRLTQRATAAAAGRRPSSQSALLRCRQQRPLPLGPKLALE